MTEPPVVSFILASTSPRRKQLLTEAGYEFVIVRPEVDESVFGGEEPHKCAERLALAKARNVAEKYPGSLVLGADTVVDFQGDIIGKANTEKEAEVIVKKLFSAPHRVITGVAVVRVADGVEIVKSDTTTIYPKVLTDNELSEHIRSGAWRDKAGAYAIKECGDAFIKQIKGSLTNVMGLPMELVGRILKSNGITARVY